MHPTTGIYRADSIDLVVSTNILDIKKALNQTNDLTTINLSDTEDLHAQ